MSPLPVVVDTNVVVSGIITGKLDSPTARILDRMLTGAFPFLLSLELLAEYSDVLRRPQLRRRHGFDDEEIDALLTEITLNGIVREPERLESVDSNPGDTHVWSLLATQAGALLVTGDELLLANPPAWASVVRPRRFLELSGSEERRGG